MTKAPEQVRIDGTVAHHLDRVDDSRGILLAIVRNRRFVWQRIVLDDPVAEGFMPLGERQMRVGDRLVLVGHLEAITFFDPEDEFQERATLPHLILESLHHEERRMCQVYPIGLRPLVIDGFAFPQMYDEMYDRPELYVCRASHIPQPRWCPIESRRPMEHAAFWR
jgi:hypothetical protein